MAPTALTRPSSSFAIPWLISAYLVSGPKKHKVHLRFQEHPQSSATSKHTNMLVLETLTSSYRVPQMDMFHTISYSIKNHGPRMTHLWVPQTGQRERKGKVLGQQHPLCHVPRLTGPRFQGLKCSSNGWSINDHGQWKGPLGTAADQPHLGRGFFPQGLQSARDSSNLECLYFQHPCERKGRDSHVLTVRVAR